MFDFDFEFINNKNGTQIVKCNVTFEELNATDLKQNAII